MSATVPAVDAAEHNFGQTKPTTCQTCGAEGLARYRGPASGPGLGSVWTYFPGLQRPDGSYIPDITQPRHGCEQVAAKRGFSAIGNGRIAEPSPSGPDAASAAVAALQALMASQRAAVDPAAIAEQIQEQTESIRAELADVRAELAAAIATAAPSVKTLRIEVTRDPSTPPVFVDSAHSQLPELLFMSELAPRALKWPLLWGAAGGGKSHAAEQVAKLLGRPYFDVPLLPGLSDSRIFGYVAPNITTGEQVYHRTALREAYENGGVICLDEIDNASDSTITGLHSMLSNGHGAFPDGRITRHPDFLLIATANTPLRGGSRIHQGRRALDGASLDRFGFCEWSYDADLEETRVAAVLPGASGKAWLGWVRDVRDYCARHVPQLIVSQRASMAGAHALHKGLPRGLDLKWLAKTYVFGGIESTTAEAIYAACPLPAVA